MNSHLFGSLVSFALFGMGLLAVIVGIKIYKQNKGARIGIYLINVFVGVFLWNIGYAWMSSCYDADFAYAPRTIALFAVVLYMYYMLKYIACVTDYPMKKLNRYLSVFLVLSVINWPSLISKSAVTFVETPWGYWYNCEMNPGRLLQGILSVSAIAMYYVLLFYGSKNVKRNRDRYVISKFKCIGPIFVVGYALDTLLPTVTQLPAIPGSSIAAFVSAVVIYMVSKDNETFGISEENVSKYVFSDVTLPVIITDENGKIVLFNDVSTDYFGRSFNEISMSSLNKLLEVYEDDKYKVINSEKICTLHSTNVQDKYGDLLYTVHFVGDITNDIKNYKMLEESRLAAESANKSKSLFLAKMSHEIRTPINAILGMDEIILRENHDKQIDEYAINIRQAGNLLLSLINEILDFSKIESGKMDILPVEYETASMLNDIYVMNEPRARKKGLELKFMIAPDLPGVLYGDDIRIKQIINNIISNAIKYTYDGSVSVVVEANHKANDRVDICFSVKDTGIGIKDEDKTKLFDSFQRLDESTTRGIEGTGLGLAITHKLLNLMDSELKFESTYGKGSVFYFVLAQKIVNKKAIGNFNVNGIYSKKEETKKATFYAPKAKVLIVDDNEMNLAVAKGLLKSTKINIDTAMNGPDSIRLVQNNKYDIIFMDHMMPGMDGVETVKRIKMLDTFPSKDAPIIALTANAISGAREMFISNGFDDFLSKPVSGQKLESMIIRYLPSEYIITADSKDTTTEPLPKDNNPVNIERENKQTDKTNDSTNDVYYIDKATAMQYCANDEDLYNEILELYISDNKLSELREHYNAKDCKALAITAHTIKSTSKNIGAINMSELALGMEMAAKKEDINYIDEHIDELETVYSNLLDKLKK